MVGEEGRAQVTAGYRQATEEANANHPHFFLPLASMGSRTLNSKQILVVMHVVDVVLDSFSTLFRFHRYSPLEKLYSVILFIAGLSLALDRLGMTYFHETLGNRNKIERLFRELKERTKRFYNNVNSKTLKSLEELVTAIAIMHNITRAGGEAVIPT